MEDKLQILNMVEDGKITAKEGVELIEALENTKDDLGYPESLDFKTADFKDKWLKLNVFTPEEDDGETTVNIKLPLSLINVGLKLGYQFSDELKNSGLTNEDLNDVLQAIEDGADGEIMNVNMDDGTKVEIIIE